MLAYILAIAVALGSLSLYLAAFLLPEVHRRYDLIWSGVGLFYALVLWVCAGRITGGVLLGHIASVSLIGWFGWQTLKLRFAETAIETKPSHRSSRVSRKEATAFDASTQASLIETVRLRIVQYRLRLRQNSETSSVLLNLDRLIESMGTVLDRLRIWISALMSTAISETIETSETSGTPQASTPPPSVTVHPPEVIEMHRPAVAKVRIEVDSLSSEPSAEEPELAAEWSDLEFDSDPDMETIDDPVDSVPDALPDALKRSQSRQAFERIRKPEGDRS